MDQSDVTPSFIHPTLPTKMLLEQHLAQLFGNLPYLPMMEIVKHLSHFQILKLAAISGNWSREIRIPRDQIDLMIHMYLTTGENYAEILIRRVKRLWIRIVVEPGASDNDLVLTTDQSIISKCENFEILQRRLLDVINRLRPVMHSLLFWEINWKFDFGFSAKLLGSLNVGEVFDLVLKAKTNRICGVELDRVLEDIKVSRLRYNIESIRQMRGGAYYLGRRIQIELEDSRWVTGVALNEQFDCRYGYFKKCRLSSQDMNKFLKIWKTGAKKRVMFLEFLLEQPIDKGEVIKGLEAKKWDPKLRSRRKQENRDVAELFEIYDLAEGLDIRNENGSLGTVFVAENQKIVRFHVWRDGEEFPLRELRNWYADMVEMEEGCLEMKNLSDLDRNYYEKRKKESVKKLRMVKKALKMNKK